MLPIKNFYGEIGGKSLNDFTKDLDYNLLTVEERIDFIKDILGEYEINGVNFYHKFWEEIFTQTFDTKLDKEGVYYVKELDMFLTCKEFEKWCNRNSVKPEEYLNLKTPYEEIGVVGDWEYTTANTSKIKLVLTSNDSIYSNTNVAKGLEKMADYILAKDKNSSDNGIKYEFYTYEDLIKLENKDENIRKKFSIATLEDRMLFYKDNSINYKKEKKQKIVSRDKEVKYLKEYIKTNDKIKNILSQLRLCDLELKSTDKLSEELQEIYDKYNNKRYLLIKVAKELSIDSLLVKDMVKGTIYFKNPLRDEGNPDWSAIDLTNKKHIRALLFMNRGNDLQNDLNCILYDLDNVIKRSRLTKIQKIVLDNIRLGKSNVDIAKELGVTKQAIGKHINSIAKKVCKQYIKENRNKI